MSQPPLRMGAVGCGNITVMRHIPAINRLETRVVAVADPVESRARAAQESAGMPTSMTFSSLEAMAAACTAWLLRLWKRLFA